jgi:hypothetical protein
MAASWPDGPYLLHHGQKSPQFPSSEDLLPPPSPSCYSWDAGRSPRLQLPLLAFLLSSQLSFLHHPRLFFLVVGTQAKA